MYKNSGPRERVLLLVRSKGSATVEELAAELRVVPVTVRSHLQALTEQGLLHAEATKGHVGRPKLRFSLTERGEEQFPKRYAGLAADFLSSLAALAGKRGLEQVLDAASSKYATAHQLRSGCSTTEDRVAHVARVLENEGGVSSWDRQAEGYVLRDFSCPYAELARESAHICRYHLLVVSKLLGEQVTLEQALSRGDDHCLFTVRKRTAQPVGVRMVSDGRVRPSPSGVKRE